MPIRTLSSDHLRAPSRSHTGSKLHQNFSVKNLGRTLQAQLLLLFPSYTDGWFLSSLTESLSVEICCFSIDMQAHGLEIWLIHWTNVRVLALCEQQAF